MSSSVQSVDDLHILGICGTFMGGLAALASELGLQLSGSDQNVYPPMSTQLESLGIKLMSGYQAQHLTPPPKLVIVGNALSRGNVAIEAVLNQRLRYISGPQWLAEQVLPSRRVVAVAGTHGKTTTTSLLAWILDHAGQQPGFLVGGVTQNFGCSARLGQGEAFVIEADEYDTAFFDKRSKFVHYRPEIVILNNLEYDHADIFPDLAAIERQFHHLIRTIPSNGRIIANADDANLARVLTQGCWSPIDWFSVRQTSADWYIEAISADGSHFAVFNRQKRIGEVRWNALGMHNLSNAAAAIAAACAFGLTPEQAIAALASFLPPKRRLEFLGEARGVSVYDDFAHHPTAIRVTLAGLRAKLGSKPIHAVLEPRSNSMRLGSHSRELAPALALADHVWLLRRPELPWDAEAALAPLGEQVHILSSTEEIVRQLGAKLLAGDAVLFMSNGGFDGIQKRLLEHLGKTAASNALQ